jgi:hypothetical protein
MASNSSPATPKNAEFRDCIRLKAQGAIARPCAGGMQHLRFRPMLSFLSQSAPLTNHDSFKKHEKRQIFSATNSAIDSAFWRILL